MDLEFFSSEITSAYGSSFAFNSLRCESKVSTLGSNDLKSSDISETIDDSLNCL